jgi:hypothetical protein
MNLWSGEELKESLDKLSSVKSKIFEILDNADSNSKCNAF